MVVSLLYCDTTTGIIVLWTLRVAQLFNRPRRIGWLVRYTSRLRGEETLQYEGISESNEEL